MRVGILGSVEVWDAGGVAFPLRPQLRRLLALLVTADGSSVSVDRIAEHITDGRLDGSVIRTAISRLRVSLGDRIEKTSFGYKLRLEPGELDADRFVHLIERARAAPDADRPALLAEGLAAWRGSALEGMGDEPWAVATTKRLEDIRATATEDLAEALLECGRAAEAVDLLGGLIATFPYRERPVAVLMRALADAGRLTEALRAYERLRAALGDDVGLEPSSALQWLEAELLAGNVPTTLELGRRARNATSGNLRRPVQTFVGRVHEVKQLVEAVKSLRLLTLVGVGGVGKTRLALEVAVASAPYFSSGVWVVELAAVADRAAVLHTTMTVLGVGTESGVSPLSSITDMLRGGPALVVIDNAEHVLEPVRELVAAVLAVCDDVHVLVTSREPLSVAGEQVHVVPPLQDLDRVDLFCERAREADDRLEYSDDERVAIEAVCARLDGLPLAIELAAARTRSLAPDDLLSRLGDRFSLLHQAHSVTDRHASLHAAIDWSYQMLDETERAVFARLSVFAGGFDLAAANAVCLQDDGVCLDASSVMNSLVDKSMVVADRRGPATRYLLLETLRQFASSRLSESGVEGETRARHVDHFDSVAGDVRRTNEVDERKALIILEREWDNLRAALFRALETGDHERAARIAANLSMSLGICRDEHATWVAAVRDVLPAEHKLSALLYCLSGWWANLLGDHEEALRLAGLGLGLAAPSALKVQIALRVVVGEAHIHRGHPDEALAAAESVLSVSPDDLEVHLGLLLACWSAWAFRPELVPGFADRLAAVARLTGRREDRHQAAYAVGIVELINNNAIAAMEHFREARTHSKGLRMVEGEALQGLTLAAVAAHDPTTPDIFLEALNLLSTGRGWAHLWMVLETLAIYWADTQRLAEAATLLGGLHAHRRATVFLIHGRRRAQAAVDADSMLGSAVRRGRAMSRADLIEFATDHLNIESNS